MTTILLLQKDLRSLVRSRLLVALLLAYPLLIAILLGLVAAYASAKPRVALVDEDGLPPVVDVGGHRFELRRAVERVGDEVTLVRLDLDEAERRLETGEVIAVVRVPPGFVAQLEAMAQPPQLELRTTSGLLASRVTQQVQAFVYSLNRELQQAFVEANLHYVRLILDGGTTSFLGRRVEVLGLERTETLLEQRLPPTSDVEEILDFVRVAELALGQTDEALRATANPIELETVKGPGRTWALSAQVQAHALALVVVFLAAVLAAAALAAEREERVLQRLVAGLATPGSVLLSKLALAALAAAVVGLGVAAAFGVAIALADVPGGEPWSRFLALAGALALAGTAAGALGTLVATLTGDGRAAVLATVLLVLPIVFVGIVPRELAPAAGWLSDALPFAHAARLFDALLYDVAPWRSAAVEAAWLAGMAAVLGVLSRLRMSTVRS